MKVVCSYCFARIFVIFFIIPSISTSCKNHLNNSESIINISSKIAGASFVAPSVKINKDVLHSLDSINSNWVCFMPYAFNPKNKPELYWNSERQWWGETKEGITNCIRMAHSNNIKVMLKPHIWIHHGGFTGDIGFDNDSLWQTWEQSYTQYIMEYAVIAEQEKVALFCIGTELKNSIINRPKYCESLINKVKKVYSGKITYAGNWDSYQLFSHWDKMDYIGIDAYFPLDNTKTPQIQQLKNAWQTISEQLKNYSDKHQKPILFTEYGYRSVDYNCKEPWESSKNGTVNLKAQSNAYEALYLSIWNKEWMAGGFLWKWFDYHHKMPKYDNEFSPQNKPAASIISKYYAIP